MDTPSTQGAKPPPDQETAAGPLWQVQGTEAAPAEAGPPPAHPQGQAEPQHCRTIPADGQTRSGGGIDRPQ